VPGGKEASFDGQVKVKQGEVTLKCDRLTIVYGEDNAINAINAIWVSPVRNVSIQPQSFNIIRSITAAGNVEIVQNERMATAGKAQFDFVKRTLVLTEGPPQIWHCPDRMVAHTIVIDLDEECKVK
jgi:lipopolysaccharide export system protein LptA